MKPVDAPLAEVSLEDKYRLLKGRIYLTGVQALVKLPLVQRELDRADGLNTAGFISGYRGSPLGTYDQQLWKASAFLGQEGVHFVPGVNEELAATAVWGTQQLAFDPQSCVDGVFAIWYGKSPGVDRAMDALRHGNAAGTSAHGGVLALAGDDHPGRSASVPNQSELDFIAAGIPVLNPSTIDDYLTLGIHGIAMSRYSGCWSAMIVLAETVDGATSLDFDIDRLRPVIPSDDAPSRHIRWPDAHAVAEARLHEVKLPAVLEYARVNRLNKVVFGSDAATLGIMTTGKAYLDVREALALLDLSDDTAVGLGIRLMKADLIWPLEPTSARAFVDGLDHVLVVEEKRATLEPQLKELLFNDVTRPFITGKTTGASLWECPSGAVALPVKGELAPGMIARVIANLLLARELPSEVRARLESRLALLDASEKEASRPRLEAIRGNASAILTQGGRTPSYCSGCPHNTSTRVPDGSRAIAGIGCHFMAQWIYPESTAPFSQMGGEGATWVGQSRFTTTPHMFVNLGDGTFYHSGLLAIRQAISAKVAVTYKILFNDAVAMTGGQPVDGSLPVPAMASVLLAEGCRRVVVVSDTPERYVGDLALPVGVVAEHRDRLDAVQRTLREIAGCTAIIYEQTCAAEKRRRRKVGQFPDPPRRVVINPEVCEGCGDCGTTSNCLSIVPLETPLGRKRAIDQSSCNKDFRCIDGFCPSFVTVVGGTLRKGTARPWVPGDMPDEPDRVSVGEHPYDILIAGVGGSGVITVGALLGMAAHLEGRPVTVLDMTGLAQKGGAVFSHVRIASKAGAERATRIRAADLLLGCDIGITLEPEALSAVRRGRTRAIVTTAEAPTGNFARDPDLPYAAPAAVRELAVRLGEQAVDYAAADKAALALLGDTIQSNVLLLGYAWQRGLIPLSRAALLRAIELNGVAVSRTQQAFEWGRLLSVRPDLLDTPADAPAPRSVEEIVQHRRRLLVDYQDESLAMRYERLVRQVHAAERMRLGERSDRLGIAAARSYFRVLAIKDEYEVARLHASPAFLASIDRMFEGDYKLNYHLAPPAVAHRDATTGRLNKRTFGSWMLPVFRVLSTVRRVRDTAIDPFARTAERREERAAIGRYEEHVQRVVDRLSSANVDVCAELLALPERVRGYGHVRANAQKSADQQATRLLKILDSQVIEVSRPKAP